MRFNSKLFLLNGFIDVLQSVSSVFAPVSNKWTNAITTNASGNWTSWCL